MNGILLVDKPLLFTSHDIVSLVRRKLHLTRVGHAGTLDPMATGLLVILIGQATKAFHQLEGDEKEYECMMTLGMCTDTQDLEGKIVHSSDTTQLNEETVRSTMSRFEGVIEQRVPRFSSVKIGGRKAYELMRRQIPFDPPTKRVEIKKLTIKEVFLPDVFFSVLVSKGTYIRALCDDMGRALGVGGVLSALRRTRSGHFQVNGSLSLSHLLNLEVKSLEERLLLFGDGHST